MDRSSTNVDSGRTADAPCAASPNVGTRPTPCSGGRPAWLTVAAAGLLVAFGLAATTRFHEHNLFNPDSADYVLQAGALVGGHGYRHVEDPSRTLQTLRPPGLSLLLMPSQWIAPYDTAAAKVTVAFVTVLMLSVCLLLTSGDDSPAGSVCVLAILASSPLTLLYGTEVLSEVPFALATLALLQLLDRDGSVDSPKSNSRVGIAFGTVLLVALPMLRTIGIAMVVAVAIWAVGRRRWNWLVAAGFGAVSFLGWVSIGKAGAGPSYLDRLRSVLAERGVVGIVRQGADALVYHFGSLLSNLVPTGSADSTLALVTIERPPSPPATLLGIVAGVLIVAGGVGLLRRRTPAGAVARLYFLTYLVCLALWPFRQERFVWPLVPLLVVFMPAGWSHLSARLGKGPRIVAATLAVSMLVGWNVYLTSSVVSASLDASLRAERFQAETCPPVYYCDWAAAGRWIEANTAPETRVLARHRSVALTGRRHLQLVRFEAVTPRQLHEEIERFGTRLLAVPSRRFTRMFPWHLLDQDTTYRFEVVHSVGGVEILAIRPNRQGTANSTSAFDAVGSARIAFERHPGRSDLRLELANALLAAGRSEDVVQLLPENTPLRAGGHLTRARALRELGRYDAARRALEKGHRVADLPLRDAFERERATLDEASATKWTPTIRDALRIARARWHVDRFDFRRAEAILSLLESDSEEAAEIQSRIDTRLGRHGDPALALRPHGAPESTAFVGLPSMTADEYGELVRRLVDDGVPGRALAMLEEAGDVVDGSPELLLQLADLQLRFADWNAAEDTLRRLDVLDPGDRLAASRLARLDSLRSRPSF